MQSDKGRVDRPVIRKLLVVGEFLVQNLGWTGLRMKSLAWDSRTRSLAAATKTAAEFP